MNFKSIIPFAVCLIFASSSAMAIQTYGQKICKSPGYTCHKVKKGQSWHSLFPNSEQRDLVKRLNRTNQALRWGNVIAIPNNLNGLSVMEIAPFPRKIAPQGSNIVKINQRELAWGAYDENGNLVNWGPMSGGKNYCPDVGRGCNTIIGTYTVKRRQGPGCKSSKFPRPNGGAPMPYCMHFKGGFAMHGSNVVPGYHASHGCVRMFTEDARWLNQNFVRVGFTKVIVTPK